MIDWWPVIEAVDSCLGASGVAEALVELASRGAGGGRLVLGVIALDQKGAVLDEAAAVLRRRQVPLVAASAKASEALLSWHQTIGDDQKANVIFSAAPNGASIARASVAVAKGLQSASVRIISTCPSTLRAALRASRQLRLTVTASHHWSPPAPADDIVSLLVAPPTSSTPPAETTLLLMEPDDLHTFLGAIMRLPAGRAMALVLGCLGSLSPNTAALWSHQLTTTGYLVLESQQGDLVGLSAYLDDQGVDREPLDGQVAHVVQAVSSLGAAYHSLHLQRLADCPDDDSLVAAAAPCAGRSLPPIRPADVVVALAKLTLPATPGDAAAQFPREFDGTSNHLTASGRLVANKYLVHRLVAKVILIFNLFNFNF